MTSARGVVLHVTQEIINNAVQRDSSHCVIADALKAAIPEATAISVDLQTIRWTDRKARKRYIYLTPSVAQITLVNFDQGVKPEPHDVRLPKPAQIVRVADRQKGKSSAKVTEPNDGLPPGTKRVVAKQGKHQSGRAAPTVLGGAYPPTAALSSTRGRRRTFGLHSLKP